MAGLTLDDSILAPAEAVKLADGNNSVAVSLTSGSWGTYSVRPGTDAGWVLFGPENTSAAISGASSTPEDKTFTPDVPGRYVAFFEGYDGADQVRLTGLFEVRSTSAGESIPAPREGVLYDASTGWTRSIEERARQASYFLRGGSTLVAITADAVTTYSRGDLVTLSHYERPFSAGIAGASLLDQPEVAGVSVNKVLSPPLGTEIVGVVLEDIATLGFGLVLLSGFIPFDKATPGISTFSDLFVNDSGALSSTQGTTYRKVGYCYAAGEANPDSTPIGYIYFNGYPEYNTTPNEYDYFPFERSLLAGRNIYSFGPATVVAEDFTCPNDIFNPSFTAQSRIQLSSVSFEVSAYATDTAETYHVELYDETSGQLVSTVHVSSTAMAEYVGTVVVGTGTGEMHPSTKRNYSLRVRSNSGGYDSSKEVVIGRAAIVAVGGF